MVTIGDLTASTIDGEGVFDVLMRANKAHLDAEYAKNRIKGAEYATVYLGSLQAVMQTALQFLLQRDKTSAEIGLIEAQTILATEQANNAILEGKVLVAQECKLRAEYDVLMQQKLKTAEEIGLLAQKKITEMSQTLAIGVDPDSVIGRQKQLYQAQTGGFTRDAEQKAADIMVKSWGVRRTTDEATVADGTNMLNDVAIGRAVTKLLAGVGA